MFLGRNIGAQSRSPTDDFWYMPAGMGTASGQRVSEASAMRQSSVFKCVRAISETVGMVPLIVYRRLQNGGKERAPKHPLAELLQERPNPWQTTMQWREMMQGHASLRGNGYSEIFYSGAGRAEMLLPLHPDKTQLEVLPSGAPRLRVQRANGSTDILVFGEFFHLAGFSSDGYVGLNPIELERESIAAAITTRDYGARFFANSARPPAWIEFAGKFKDDDAKRAWLASFHENYGGANTGRTPVFEHGMKLHELGIKNVDAEYMDSRKYSDNDIAGIFRVPPHKIGILDQAKWANIEQQSLEWVQDTIMPWCVRWEQALQRDLLFGEDYFAEHLLDMLLRGDTKSRYEAYGKAINDGWMVRNEVRMRENLNPLPGLDTPLQPLNMGSGGQRSSEKPQSDKPASDNQADDEEANARHQSRALAIETAAAGRVARKEVAALQRMVRADAAAAAVPEALALFFAEHAGFVADVMALSPELAASYCAATCSRLVDLHTAGRLEQLLAADYTATQTAALLRLGDH